MEQDEQYRQYEGLAVAAAARVFNQWRKGLQARGVSIEDACQEGRTALLELLPKLDDPQYGPEQRCAFVAKSIRGRLNNWAAKQSRNGDKREPRPPHNGPDPADLADLNAAMATLDPDVAAMVMQRYGGATYKSIGRDHGLSAGQAASRIAKALAVLKKKMHA